MKLAGVEVEGLKAHLAGYIEIEKSPEGEQDEPERPFHKRRWRHSRDIAPRRRSWTPLQ